MKRKVKEYSEREAEFLITGRDMFFSKGYANTSINDIIDRMDVAKGTFYHYFSSKEDLLDKIVIDFTEKIFVKVKEIAEDSTIGAVEKFNSAYKSIRDLKFENIELMIVLMKVLYSDDNILLRHKMFRQTIKGLTPVWAGIISQGVREGVFNCSSPLETSEFIFAISTYLNEDIVSSFSNIEEDPGVIVAIKNKIESFEKSIERLLGAEEGTIGIFEMEYLEKFLENFKQI